MKFRFVFTLTLAVLSLQGWAQSYSETARLFSRTSSGGSARAIGMGGGYTSIGGDPTAALVNPAGLGMYNRTEISVSLGQGNLQTGSTYLGTSDEASRSRLLIPALGVVFNKTSNATSGFIGGTFAITMNRVADFNQTIQYRGTNPATSMIDFMIDQAGGWFEEDLQNGGPMANSLAGLGYNNYLIGPQSLLDPDAPQDQYFTDVITIPEQSETIDLSGGIQQWNLSWGGNYNDQIFFGAGIGIPTLQYRSDKNYTEQFPNDPYLTSFNLQESLNIQGGGVNATLGVIFRPVEFIQVGMRYTTPTSMRLSESYTGSISSEWQEFDYYGDGTEILTSENAETDIIVSNYSLRLPSKLSAGITLRSAIGFITGDIEYSNPSNAKYKSRTEGLSFDSDNGEIGLNLQQVINFRAGGELRINKFRVRGGLAGFGNSLREGKVDSYTSYNAGIGYREANFYIDFGVLMTRRSSEYQPYGSISPVASLDQQYVLGLITLGFLY